MRSRLAIVEGLLSALERRVEILEVVGEADDRSTAVEVLTSPPFSFPKTVALHILDMPFGRTTKRGVDDIRLEAAELRGQ